MTSSLVCAGRRAASQVREQGVDEALLSLLLVRPTRVDSAGDSERGGESKLGFWLRIANDNGLAVPSWLLKVGARPPLRVLKFCPMCLAEPLAYWKSLWLEPDRWWCDEHGVWLMDRCSSCCQFLRWNRARYRGCQCHAALTAIRPAPLESSVTVACEQASIGTLKWLGAFSVYGPTGKPLKKAARQSVEASRCLILAGADLVLRWPQGLREAMDRHRVWPERAGIAQLLHEAFPRLMKLTKSLPDRGWRERFTSELARYVADCSNGAFPLLGRNPGVRGAVASLTDRASSMRVRFERVQAAIDHGGVDVRGVRVTQGGRRRRVMNEADVERLARVLGDAVGVKPMAKKLGLAPRRVQALVAANLLVQRSGRLSRDAVHQFAQRIVGGAQDLPAGLAAVKLRDALRFRIASPHTGPFFESLMDGAMPCYRPSDTCTVGTLCVLEADVTRWLADRTALHQDQLTLPQVAERMGEKQQVIYDLVAAGLLDTTIQRIANRACRVVSPAEVERFAQRYVALNTLAAGYGVAHKAAYVWALKEGITVVTGPEMDGRRKYFVNKRDIRRLGRGERAASHVST